MANALKTKRTPEATCDKDCFCCLQTALKTLMVMHRLMRESNISFVEEVTLHHLPPEMHIIQCRLSCQTFDNRQLHTLIQNLTQQLHCARAHIFVQRNL